MVFFLSKYERGTPAERFHKHYMPVTECGCWIWLKRLNDAGYGMLGLANKTHIRAHRFSYLLHVGPIPVGLIVRHTCDVRCCVNPDHLLLGTRPDNAEDAARRKRFPRDERHHNTRLSLAQIAAIRQDQRPRRLVASEYGVHPTYIGMLQRAVDKDRT